ncbi:isopenicillin N synthase family dioxygenase [Modestobacter roseus]|uniref:Isopenicillin N synthase-like dioxygenase n=1 Tax=Modestobacter roseus TaxID=1181884 RepID=A0A562IMT8_9ACTN|nr:2-oxoglutarate and iron-dependent oxygenase domain-containing protein [Modestobacter roseus]MQA34260.1 isopenicillin N synthase family oxygenase [Modestobacter roseus]TWH71904.1 isopenicillin N synthase-like dioxygenase [Modestobacter roseus]
MTVVPLVDLAPWYRGDAAARRQVATDVDRALCELGVLNVTGHPVSAALTYCVREEARSFFAQPPAVKAALACFPGGRGWVPPAPPGGTGAPPDLREQFCFGPEPEPGTWPTGTPSLRPAATAFAAGCAALAAELLRVLALALDLPEDFFVARCPADAWAADLSWYPARSAVGSVAPGQLRVGAHTDDGVLALTDHQAGIGGLQVRTPDDEWVDAPAVPGALTVNAGDLLARWTGDRWRSAPHRVLPPPVEAPAEELLALALRQDADPLALVERLPTPAAGPTRYPPVTAGEFLRDRRGSVAVG